MKKRMIFVMIAVLIVPAILILPTLHDNMKYDVSRDKEFSSPNGSRTITLRYDYVSRPYLFDDNELLFAYSGSGFNETVSWEIEWLSENELVLHYSSPNGKNDEAYQILLSQ